MIKKIANKENKKVRIISTVDYVKEIAKSFGWNGEKDLKSRKMLSQLKDVLTEWNDVPHKVIEEKIKDYQEDNIAALFIDSREPSDIAYFSDKYHALTILMRRPNLDMIYGNHADDQVDNYEYDIMIDNSRGLKELEEEAICFYETFIKEES